MGESNIGRRRALALKDGSAAYLEKRDQVVQAAAELFRAKGFRATTLADIAGAVGIDRASLYYYCKSKEELLQEAVSGVTTGNLEMVRGLRDSDLDPAEQLSRLIRNAISSFHENYPHVFVYIQEDMTQIAGRKDPWARAMLKQTRQFEEALLELLRDGVDEGRIRGDLDLEIVSQAFWGMINWTHRWYRPSQHAPGAVAKVFSAVFLEGVVTSPPQR